MLIISKSKSENEVGKALESLIREINYELEKVDGIISSIDCDVSVSPLEAAVSLSVFIEGEEPRRKFLIGVNEKGFSRENSMKKAEKRANSFIKDRGGKIAGSFIKTISSLPGRVYTTMIMAINEVEIEDAKDAETRRNRIKKSLLLLGDDPSVLNVAKIAGVFGVSRTMIYKDLEVLGYKRG